MSQYESLQKLNKRVSLLERVLRCVNCKNFVEVTDCEDDQVPTWDAETQTWVCGDSAGGHDPVTLNADQATQEAATLTGQELQLIPATSTTYGVVKLEDLFAQFERVDNFAALPDPTLHTDEYYHVVNSQGSSFWPGWVGGTFYSKGFYYSSGTEWIFIGEVPYQATQGDVDAGIITDQFVTPATLASASQWGTKHDAIQFQDEGISLGTSGDTDTVNFTGAGVTASRVADVVTVNIGGGGSVSFGTDNQVPFVNAGGTDFDYSANFTMSGTAFGVDNSNVVFNESGVDVDFRVEGVGQANALFVDGTNGRVGVGMAAPLGTLHIETTNSSVAAPNESGDDLVVENNNNTGISILCAAPFIGSIYFGDGASNFSGIIRYSHALDQMQFWTSGSNKMVIEPSGLVGMGVTTAQTNLHIQESNTDVVPTVEIEQLSTGDAGLQFSIPGDAYAVGIDNSDNDRFKISYAAAAGTAVLGTNDLFTLFPTGEAVFASTVRLKGYTVATLPATPVQGDTAFCTDLTAPTYLGVAVGGGAVVAKVFFDGTNWIT